MPIWDVAKQEILYASAKILLPKPEPTSKCLTTLTRMWSHTTNLDFQFPLSYVGNRSLPGEGREPGLGLQSNSAVLQELLCTEVLSHRHRSQWWCSYKTVLFNLAAAVSYERPWSTQFSLFCICLFLQLYLVLHIRWTKTIACFMSEQRTSFSSFLLNSHRCP